MSIPDFLNAYKIPSTTPKGSVTVTHTSMKPPSSFHIYDKDDVLAFMTEYKQAISDNATLSVVERPTEKEGPIRIDFDFRFRGNSLTRSFGKDLITKIVGVYSQILEQTLILTSPDTQLTCIVTMRDKPYASKEDQIKDGIHIQYPFCLTSYKYQYWLRKKAISEMEKLGLLSSLELTNPMDDVVDKAVIESSGWMLYGSRKWDKFTNTMLPPYTIWFVFDKNMQDLPVDTWSREELIDILSIRLWSYNQTLVRAEPEPTIDMERGSPSHQTHSQSVSSHQPPYQRTMTHEENDIVQNALTVTVKSEDVQFAANLVILLNLARSNSYHEWIRVGWCLHNISPTLLSSWIQFSKRSPKFVEGECQHLWRTFKRHTFRGYGLGTLCMWAQEDNPTTFKELRAKKLSNMIVEAADGAEGDIAEILYRLTGSFFVCASIRNKQFFEFKNHRWSQVENGRTLREYIINEVSPLVKTIALDFYKKYMDSDCSDGGAKVMYEKLQKLTHKLKTTSYLNNLIQECANRFYVDKFVGSLDANTSLLGFNNGVFDLGQGCFRDGRPEDMVSMSTGLDYVAIADESQNERLNKIKEVLGQIQTVGNVLDYLLMFFARCCSGENPEQQVWFWLGSGCNGKSLLVEFFESCLGDYAKRLPPSVLTQKRPVSNSAQPEVSRLAGARFVVAAEPDLGCALNTGLIKEWSGGDKVAVRGLYQDTQDVQFQFKLVFMTNALPKVASDDNGTWRRIRVLNFGSEFVDNWHEGMPPHLFPRDRELKDKIKHCRQEFMWLLLNKYYPMVKGTYIREPTEVLEMTSVFKETSDIIQQFIRDAIEQDPNGSVTIDIAYKLYKFWLSENGDVKNGMLLKSEFKAKMEKRLGPMRNKVWSGYSLKDI